MSEINNLHLINLPLTQTPGRLANSGKKRAVPRTDLYSLNDGQKQNLSKAAGVAIDDPAGVQAKAFLDAGLNKNDIQNIADGKLSEIGPLSTADVNNLVAVADKTKPKLEENTDPVVMGGATNKPPQGIRDKGVLALADVAWFGAGNATIVGEQPEGIGDGVVALNGIGGVGFDRSQIIGSSGGVSFQPAGDKQQAIISQGLGNLIT